MSKLTIGEIETRLLNSEDLSEEYIKTLKQDSRKGVQLLLKKWIKQKEQAEELKMKFFDMTQYERRLRNEGYKKIVGIDEVGRGPLAGPVVAAAVMLDEKFYLPGIDDSKKLSEQKREEFFEVINQEAIEVSVAIINTDEIDEINILEASKKAMLSAICELKIAPDYLLVDAVKLSSPYPQEAIIKGDSKSVSIAAASIIAKVTRDRLMKELDLLYPEYGFSKNMGYGTAEHLKALAAFGATPIHRKSFAPVKELYINS